MTWLEPWVRLEVFVGVAIATVILITYLLWVLVRALREGERNEADEGGEADAIKIATDVGAMELSFRLAGQALSKEFSHGAAREAYPLFLMMAREAEGEERVMASLDLPVRFAPGLNGDADAVLSWFFLEGGGVVQPRPDIIFDGSDEGSSVWLGLLRKLVRNRPTRPLDGVIVEVRYDDLEGVVGPDDTLRVKGLGREIRYRLRQVGSELGIHVPVYLLVTGMESIPGFSEYVEILPIEARSEAMGWSSPYNVEAAYQAQWFDEALDCVANHTLDAQLDTFARIGAVESLAAEKPQARLDSVLLFGEGISKVRRALSYVVEEAFRDSRFGVAGFFRGIYFSGLVQAEAAMQPTESADSAANGERFAAFASGLFRRVVFREASLSVAIAEIVKSRQRGILGLQVACFFVALFGGAMWFRASAIDERQAAAAIHLETLRDDLSLDATRENTTERAEGLLLALDSIESHQLWDYGIPASWPWMPGSVVSTTQAAVTNVFGQAILRSLRDLLIECAAAASTGVGEQSLCVFRDDEVHPARNFGQYLSGLDEVVTNIARYNHLASDDEYQAQALVELIRSLLDPGFQASVIRQDKFYSDAVRAVTGEQISSGDVRSVMFPEDGQLLVDHLGRAYRGVIRELGDLADGLEALGGAPENEVFEIAWAVDSLASDIRAFSAARLSPDSLLFPFRQVLDTADTLWLRTLSDSLKASVSGLDPSGAARNEGLSEADVASLLGEPTESLLAGPTLLSIVEHLLVDWRAAHAAAGRAPAPSSSAQPGPYRALWRATELGSAVVAHDAFVEHVGTRDSLRLDDPLRGVWDALKLGARADILNEGTQAARFEMRNPPGGPEAREQALFREVGVIATADADMQAALTAMDALMRPALGYQTKAADYAATLLSMLAEASRLLDDAYPISRANLNAWEDDRLGTRLLAAEGDDTRGSALVGAERARVFRIVDSYVRPVLAALEGDGFRSFESSRGFALDPNFAEFEFWKNTRDAVDAYREDESGPVARVGELLLTTLPDLTPETCADLRTPGGSTPSDGFFSERLNTIVRQVSDRCVERVTDSDQAGEASLFERYASSIHGRIYLGGRLDPEDSAFAEAAAFAAFFDSVAPPDLAPVAPDVPFEGLQAVAQFFALSTGDTLGVQLDVSFRPSGTDGPLTNQVLFWEAWAGDEEGVDTVSLHDDPDDPPLFWRANQGLGLTFTWAENSDWTPDDSQESPSIEVDNVGRSVTLRLASPWALLELLSAEDLVRDPFRFTSTAGEDPSVYRLTLSVPIVRRDRRGPRPPPPVSLVVDITLRDPESLRPIDLTLLSDSRVALPDSGGAHR